MTKKVRSNKKKSIEKQRRVIKPVNRGSIIVPDVQIPWKTILIHLLSTRILEFAFSIKINKLLFLISFHFFSFFNHPNLGTRNIDVVAQNGNDPVIACRSTCNSIAIPGGTLDYSRKVVAKSGSTELDEEFSYRREYWKDGENFSNWTFCYALHARNFGTLAFLYITSVR